MTTGVMTPQKASFRAVPTLLPLGWPLYPRLREMMSTAAMMNRATTMPGTKPAAKSAGHGNIGHAAVHDEGDAGRDDDGKAGGDGNGGRGKGLVIPGPGHARG